MLDFPANPTIGQVFASGGVTWIWDGAKWTLSAVPGGGTSITIGDIPPTNPAVGALWWHSASGQLYVFYNDGTSSQWVPTTNQMGGGYATTAYVDAARLGDNRIINGDMRIDQRNNGASGTASGYTVDRWAYAASLATKGTWARNGPGNIPGGFQYSLGFVSNSAYAVLAADYFGFQQRIEADAISDFQWGTASAQSVTLSFMAYSSLGGTFGGSVGNVAATRSYPFTYVLSAATWTKIVITIPGDTGGTWVLSGNGGSVVLNFSFGVGATYSGPVGVWGSANYVSANGAVSVVGTNGATFYVTGVKLEIGSVATPFNRQSLAKSMADCQRYFQVGQAGFQGWGTGASGGPYISQSFPVQMRAGPTFVIVTNNSSNVGTLNYAPLAPAGMGLTLIASVVTTTGLYTLNVNYTASAEL